MAVALASLIRLFVTVLSLSLQVLIKLRLDIPLLYTVLMVAVFDEWAAANNTLAVGILVAQLAVVGLSWVVSLVNNHPHVKRGDGYSPSWTRTNDPAVNSRML